MNVSCYAGSRYQDFIKTSKITSNSFLQEKEKKIKIEKVNDAQAKFKKQMFGNVKFIAELFKLKVSSSPFVNHHST